MIQSEWSRPLLKGTLTYDGLLYEAKRLSKDFRTDEETIIFSRKRNILQMFCDKIMPVTGIREPFETIEVDIGYVNYDRESRKYYVAQPETVQLVPRSSRKLSEIYNERKVRTS